MAAGSTTASAPSRYAVNGAPTVSTVPAVAAVPPRRHWSVWRALLGVLLVVVGALAAMTLANRSEERVTVWVSTRALPAGQVLTAADVRARSMDAAAVADLDGVITGPDSTVVGRATAMPIAAGVLLSAGLLGDRAWPPAGAAVTAVAVPAGGYPPSLSAGTSVEVILSPAGDGQRSDSSAARERVSAVVVSIASAASGDGSAVIELQLPTAGAVAVASAGSVRLVAVSGQG